MSDGKSTVSKKVSEFTSDNVGAVKLAQLEKGLTSRGRSGIMNEL